jgi:hypothetical protein
MPADIGVLFSLWPILLISPFWSFGGSGMAADENVFAASFQIGRD